MKKCGGEGVPLFLLLYSSVQSHLQSFELAMQDFHPHSHSSLVLKPGIICTYLIHSGSLQKMLTALFNLVRNFGIHRKVYGQFFLSTKAKCFLVLKGF